MCMGLLGHKDGSEAIVRVDHNKGKLRVHVRVWMHQRETSTFQNHLFRPWLSTNKREERAASRGATSTNDSASTHGDF